MKVIFSIVLLLMSVQLFHGQAIELPEQISRSLDKSFPGWRLSRVDKEIVDFLNSRMADSQPNLISGDFDGDGHEDYALLIEHTNFTEPGKTFTHVLEKLVFLKRGTDFKRFELEKYTPANSIVYMTLAKKGEKSREFESGKEFVYDNDSISISYLEKASGTYIYENEKFRYVTESD